MSSELHQAAFDVIASAGPRGLPMGQVVDRLLADGFAEGVAEQAVWHLLQQGAVLAPGFVRRVLRRHDRARGFIETRTYEFVLSVETTPSSSP